MPENISSLVRFQPGQVAQQTRAPPTEILTFEAAVITRMIEINVLLT